MQHALRLKKNNIDEAIEWLFEHRHEASNVIEPGLDSFFYCETEEIKNLLSNSSSHTFIDSQEFISDPILSKFFTNPILQKTMNIVSFEPNLLGDIVSRAIPLHWRGKEIMSWTGAADEPTVSWFVALFAYCEKNNPTTSLAHIAEQYCCLPTNQEQVVVLSKSSSVVDAKGLPPEVAEAIVSAGCRTLLSELVLSPTATPSFYEYIFEGTAAGIILALDAASRDDDSNMDLTPEAAQALYNFIFTPLVKTVPMLSPTTLVKLEQLPIFNTYTESLDTPHFVSLDVEVGASFFVLTPPFHDVDEQILTILYSTTATNNSNNKFIRLSPSSDGDGGGDGGGGGGGDDDFSSQLNVLKQLNSVTLVDRRNFLLRFVFPNMQLFPIPIVNEIMAITLMNLTNICKEDANFRTVVTNTFCVPSQDQKLHKPSELFDPGNAQLRILLDDDSFPHSFYTSSNDLLVCLRLVGLQSTLDFDLVVEVAKRIEKTSEKNEEEEIESVTGRALELLRFLDRNMSTFFPELFPQPKSARKSFFSTITTTLFSDDTKKREELLLKKVSRCLYNTSLNFTHH